MNEYLSQLVDGEQTYSEILQELNVRIMGSTFATRQGIDYQIIKGIQSTQGAFMIFYMHQPKGGEIMIKKRIFGKKHGLT